MGTKIKKFSDESILEFDDGKFDKWCVYLIERESKIAPKDVDYFCSLQNLAKKHGAEIIYHDFVEIFDNTTKYLNKDLLSSITEKSIKYNEDSLQMDKYFTIFYAGMIAEENKKHAILKKRIKRLGLHQILIEDADPKYAATFSKGKKWRELDVECTNRGF